MLINKLQLINFKRFTDLTIDLDPKKTGKFPKLVLLIGANGSGKSSVFDAFQHLKADSENGPINSPSEYNYLVKEKKGLGEMEVIPNNNDNSGDYDFYGMTAFRYIPTVTKSQIGGTQSNPYKMFIEEEKDKFDQNIDILYSKLFDVINNTANNIQDDFGTNFVNKMKSGFKNIFGESETSLNFVKNISPIIGKSPVKFIFNKGVCGEIDYSCLSAGEKMIFIILFDLFLNVTNLVDTVIYLDELDSHLNTSLQKNLLKEITENWIPDSCQLWTASHSLGFIQYATESENGEIIDLDNLNFDKPQTIYPTDKNDPDLKFLDVAVGQTILNTLLREVSRKNEILAFSEGNNFNYLNKAKEFFAPNLNVKFLDGGGSGNLQAIFEQVKSSKDKFLFIFDCDAEKQANQCKKVEKTVSIAILIQSNNKNTKRPRGIENLFPENLFDFSKDYFESATDLNGDKTLKLSKKKFEEFIFDRNNPEDFVNFKPLLDEIEELLTK